MVIKTKLAKAQTFEQIEPKRKMKPGDLPPPLKRVPGMGKNMVYDGYVGRYVVYRRTS